MSSCKTALPIQRQTCMIITDLSNRHHNQPMSSSVTTIKDKWLLTLVEPNPNIKSEVRLPKYVIPIRKGILNNSEFFDGWESNKYGMYSPQLSNSLKKFESEKFEIAISDYYSNKDSTRNYYFIDNILTAIDEGIDKKDQIAKIECIDCTDFQKSPKEVISDAHLKVIDFTDKSIIGAMIGAMISATIGRGVIINTSFQNSENNPDEKESNPTKPPNSTKEHVFDDEEFRLKLAKSIGYDKIPPLDNTAFDRLKGLFADKIESEYFDAVELVKESRGC